MLTCLDWVDTPKKERKKHVHAYSYLEFLKYLYLHTNCGYIVSCNQTALFSCPILACTNEKSGLVSPALGGVLIIQ